MSRDFRLPLGINQFVDETPAGLCEVPGGQGGNSATIVNVPVPSGVLKTLVGGGLFALKRSMVCCTFV